MTIGVAGDCLLRRFAQHLNPDAPLDDEQPLRAVVRVPVRARARLELHTVDIDRRAGLVGRERRALDRAA